MLDHIIAAESYLLKIESEFNVDVGGFCYDNLVFEHVRMAVSVLRVASNDRLTDVRRAARRRVDGRRWLLESMHLYWDKLPSIAGRLKEQTGCDTELAMDAWITMIFRAFCWHHCHRLVPRKKILPSEWFGSKMPVYIG